MDYLDDQENESLGGMFDFLTDDGDSGDDSPGIFETLVSEAKDIGSDIYTDVKTQVKAKADEEIAEGKAKLDEALDFEAKAKASAQKKIDAELERASRNIALSIIDLFTEDEIKTLERQGKIVVDKDGRAVRNVETGEILSLAQYKVMIAERAKQTKQLAGLIAGLLGAYRDDPTKRAEIDRQYETRIKNAATLTERNKLIADHNKLKDWLRVNPSPDTSAQTASQKERLAKWADYLLAIQIQAIKKFRDNPNAYARYQNEIAGKISAAQAAGRDGEVARLKRQAEIFGGAVKSTQQASVYLAQKKRELARAITEKGSVAATAAIASGEGGGGALLAAALGIGLLLLG